MVRGARWVVGLAVALAGASPARADDYIFQARLRGWYVGPGGTIRLDTGAAAGTSVDLQNDLGLTRKLAPEIDLTLRPRPIPMRVSLAFWTTVFEERTNLTQTVTVEGLTFPVTTSVNTRMRVSDVTARWIYEIYVPTPPHQIVVGPGVAVKYVELKGSVRGTAGGAPARASETARGPVPMIGGLIEIPFLRYFEVEAQAWYLPSVTVGSITVSWLEAQAGLKVLLHPNFFLEGGFKYTRPTVSRPNRFNFRGTFTGFYFGLGARL